MINEFRNACWDAYKTGYKVGLLDQDVPEKKLYIFYNLPEDPTAAAIFKKCILICYQIGHDKGLGGLDPRDSGTVSSFIEENAKTLASLEQ